MTEPEVTLSAEALVKLLELVDESHQWWLTDGCHPEPGRDCRASCVACEAIASLPDELRGARPISVVYICDKMRFARRYAGGIVPCLHTWRQLAGTDRQGCTYAFEHLRLEGTEVKSRDGFVLLDAGHLEEWVVAWEAGQ